MPLKIEDFGAFALKQRFFRIETFQISVMADDWLYLYKSSPNWEKGAELFRLSGVTGYATRTLTDIPVYDGFTHFIALIVNGYGPCGINIRHAANQKCFVPVETPYWGGWGRADPLWANVGCWAKCSIGANSSAEWKIKVPMT